MDRRWRAGHGYHESGRDVYRVRDGHLVAMMDCECVAHHHAMDHNRDIDALEAENAKLRAVVCGHEGPITQKDVVWWRGLSDFLLYETYFTYDDAGERASEIATLLEETFGEEGRKNSGKNGQH